MKTRQKIECLQNYTSRRRDSLQTSFGPQNASSVCDLGNRLNEK